MKNKCPTVRLQRNSSPQDEIAVNHKDIPISCDFTQLTVTHCEFAVKNKGYSRHCTALYCQYRTVQYSAVQYRNYSIVYCNRLYFSTPNFNFRHKKFQNFSMSNFDTISIFDTQNAKISNFDIYPNFRLLLEISTKIIFFLSQFSTVIITFDN